MKEIKDYPGYFVTRDGKILSTNGRWDKSPKQLKVVFCRRGYNRVALYNEERKLFSVHRLVAEAYIPNPNNLPQVDHLDGNKNNNCVDNLEWVSMEENMSRRFSLQHHLKNVKTGELKIVYNLKEWCKDNSISHSNLYQTRDGIRRTHVKGWKLISI